jgi:pyridoxal 5'-phosphate synthase subunit Pdx1
MNLWVRLPEPLDAGELLPRAQKEGVAYLPGATLPSRAWTRARLRLSFAGLDFVYPCPSVANNVLRRTKGFGLAEMLKGGVIMDVTNAEQAKIAEEGRRRRRDGAGARAVRYPQGRRRGPHGQHRQDREIMQTVTIPVMAKARIGHFMEARILEALGVDYIDESEVLTPADEEHHIDKRDFKVPFVCGARNLGEALRRIAEGAAMIRTKGEAGSGNIVEAVRHIRTIVKEMKQLTVLGKEELVHQAKNLQAPLELVEWVASTASCRCRISPPAASPRRPTPRW